MVSNNDVLGWLKANQGKGYDFDGVWNVQCMDLINQVTVSFFGVNITAGKTYPPEVWAGALPSGWTKHSTSQPGDIFVTFACPATPVGHIGFIAEDNSHVYDQNGTSQNDPITYRNGYDGCYLGFIRPPYSGGSGGTQPPTGGGKATSTGPKGKALIKDFEKCVLTAYDNNDGMITIGWGHAEPKGNTNLVAGVTRWSQAQADSTFESDLKKYEKAVNDYFTRSFNQNQFDAMVSFTYNLGVGVFANDGWDRNASNEYILASLPKYINKGSAHEPGLVRRRNAEIALFNTPVSGGGSETDEGEIEMILYKVNDKNSKMNGSIWMFNGEQLTRLDGVSAAKFAKNFKTTDVNQAEMSSFKNIGFRTVGEFKY